MASRTLPQTAQKNTGDLITGALWNAGVKAVMDFVGGVPSFLAFQNASQTLISGSWAPIFFQANALDTDGGHSNTINPSRYTCQVAGWYYIEGYVALNNGQNASRFEAAVAKNGSTVGGSAQFLLRLNDLQALMAGTLLPLAVGDYVEIWGRQASPGNLNTYIGTDLLSVMNGFWVHS